MASSQPDPEEELAQQQHVFQDYNRFLHASTLAACVLAPVLIALPPRKIDLYTFSLSGAFLASVNYQTKERTGLGIMGHASRRVMLTESQNQYDQNNATPAAWGSSRLLEENSPFLTGNTGTSMLQQRAQENWKQQRLKEEQEKLDEGEGYWEMIVDQVWQVWNQGEKKKVEELKEQDEEVVKKRGDKG